MTDQSDAAAAISAVTGRGRARFRVARLNGGARHANKAVPSSNGSAPGHGPGLRKPIPAWPGELVVLEHGPIFVREAPATPGTEPAVFVHGLGGSATNWTDLMGLLSQPRRGAPVPRWRGT